MVSKPQISLGKGNPAVKSGTGASGQHLKPDSAPANAAKPKKPKIKKTSGLFYKINEYLKRKFCTEQQVIGVEIQPDTIKFCQARQENSNWKIEKIGSANVLSNYQQDSLKKNKKIYAKALKDLFEQNKIENTSVALSIPAALAIIKTISLPMMPRENLERATRIPSFWQNLVQISDNLADYSIYYRIVKENSATKEMDVLFVASKHEELKTYVEIAKEAGLEPCVIDVGCFSINNVSKLRTELVSDLQVFLKVGRDENYLQILEQGKPYIYDIFVSDNEKSYLNEFLENPTFQQRFVSQLNHIISKHQDKNKIKIDKIDVISSEANIDKFIAAIAPKMEGMQLSIIDLLANIQMPQELLNNDEFQKTKSSYAVCTGLATRNLNIFDDDNKKNVSETINLLPEGDKAINALKAKFYSKLAVWAVTILCTMFIFIFSITSVIEFSTLSSQISKFNQKNTIYKTSQATFNDINSQGGMLNKIIKIKDSIQQNQPEIIKSLQEISNSIPEGVWIEQIDFTKEGKISITGRAFEEKGIIAFSRAFDASETIVDVSIASLKSTTLENGSTVKEFLISGVLKSTKNKVAAPVAEEPKTNEKPVKQPTEIEVKK